LFLIYYLDMRFLIIMLVLAIGAQPLQAGSCDMETDQESSHHMDQSINTGHDCCDSDKPDAPPNCDSEMHCGYCTSAVSSLPLAFRIDNGWMSAYSLNLSSGLVAPSHSSPPFRPPIS
jgi:hypothetical protein